MACFFRHWSFATKGSFFMLDKPTVKANFHQAFNNALASQNLPLSHLTSDTKGADYRRLYKYKQGIRFPNVYNGEKLSRMLKLSLDNLIGINPEDQTIPVNTGHLPDEKQFNQRMISRLNAILVDQGITQAKLAKLSGVSQGMLSRYLRYDRVPGLDVMANIAQALNIPLSELTKEEAE